MLLQLPVALQAPRLYAPLLSRLSHHTLQCWRMHLPQPAVRQQLLSVTDRLQQQRQQTSLLIVVVMLLLGGTPCFMLQWIVLILQCLNYVFDKCLNYNFFRYDIIIK